MKLWLLPALTIAFAVPAIAEAQYRTDTTTRDTMVRRDTVITQTQTETIRRSDTDTVYRGSGQVQGSVTSPSPSYGVSGSVTDTTTRTTAPTYGAPTYATSTVTVQEDDDDHDQRAGFEVKGGLSWGNVSNHGILPGTLHGRNGIALGLAMYGGSPVGFGIEGLYVQRGVDNDIAFSTDGRALDYIDVPAYLRISVPFALQPFVYAGPQASFEVRCRAGTLGCPDTDRPSTSWSAVIGAGVRLNPGFALSIDGRYVYGLTDLHLSTVTTSSSYRTRSFMLLAGIGF